MAETSVAAETRDILSRMHAATRLGRAADAPGDAPAVVPPDLSTEEVNQYLLLEVQTLEAIVVRLANEVDRLRAAEAVR